MRRARDVHVGGIELAAKGVHTEEVAVEARAEPPPVLGHEHPVLGLALSAGEAPGIESIHETDGRAVAHPVLQSEIGSGGEVVQQVVFTASCASVAIVPEKNKTIRIIVLRRNFLISYA